MATKKNAQVKVNTEVQEVLTTLKVAVEQAREKLQAEADKRNELRMNEDFAGIEVSKANGKELEKVCAKACKDATFYELAFTSAEGEVMKNAIKVKSYMTYVLKDNKDADTDTITTEVEVKEVIISLKEMDTYCTTHGVKGSVDKSWDGEFKALSGAIILQTVLGFTDKAKQAEVIKRMKTDYYFSKALVKYEDALKDADKPNPASNTQILKLGQTMVEHLVGQGYVFKSEDYEFLKMAATNYDKRSQDADVMKSRDLYNLNNRVFQHIVYGTAYELKAKKN